MLDRASVSSSVSIRVLASDDGVAVAEIGPVCVVIWSAQVTRERFEKQRDGLAKVVARHPGKAGFLCVIEPAAKPPDQALRRASADMVASHRGQLKCLGTVIEASGFKASVVRSVLAGMTLMAGNRGVLLQYFESVQLAVHWMAKHIAIEPDAIADGVESLRWTLHEAQRKPDVKPLPHEQG